MRFLKASLAILSLYMGLTSAAPLLEVSAVATHVQEENSPTAKGVLEAKVFKKAVPVTTHAHDEDSPIAKGVLEAKVF
ncbi:hypothetical protein ONZ43_g11 [Nemania bipapillata]|uniref:Uncharacterized protein n=1 Tax=Nemania bipapillata TaxID=110536 RepID=A0ACC2JA42_9PEZI|nr:hypothetical protein ONZ43_g11 [Nemania bipapillata]